MTLNDDLSKDLITFYVTLCNLHTIKLDKKTLSKILHQHVMPIGRDQTIKLISYFRPQKLDSCFSTRPPKIDPDRVSLVYQSHALGLDVRPPTLVIPRVPSGREARKINTA